MQRRTRLKPTLEESPIEVCYLNTHTYIWIYIYHSFSIEIVTRISIDILNQQFIVVTL